MIELSEGQQILINAAKYLLKRWKETPIRSADINDKLASDKLVWLVHNFDFEELTEYAFKHEDGDAFEVLVPVQAS